MIEEIEQKLLEQRPIRLEKTLRDRGEERLEEFIKNFLTDYNENKNTIYVDTKEIQCDTGRRRSIDDIFLICHYYYGCSLKDVAMILFHILPLNMEEYRSSYCGTINKRVFYWNGGRAFIYNKYSVDQHGMKWNDWLV